MPRQTNDDPATKKLHVRLLKQGIDRISDALEVPEALSSYGLRSGLGFSGRL